MKKIILVLIALVSFVNVSLVSAANFIVDNLGDNDNGIAYTLSDGTNTLRKCIRLANATAGAPHTITFSVAGIINVNSTGLGDLPQINSGANASGLTINANSAPGYAGVPIIVLNRTGGPGADMEAFDIHNGVNNVTIRGFVIQNFETGIRFRGTNTGGVIENNYIGLNATGTSKAGTALNGRGIWLANCTGFTIGGTTAATRNVISGCLNQNGAGRRGAIHLENGSHGNTIIGNYIGTNAAGNAGIGNGNNEPLNQHGIYMVNSSSPGSPVIIDQNVISGNIGNGIWADGGCSAIRITGNKLGTNALGMARVPNKAAGIRIEGGSAHTIGGNTAAARNIISGNGGAPDSRPCRGDYCGAPSGAAEVYDGTLQCGIYFNGVTTSAISGNYIGVNATGLDTLGNLYAGIKLENNSDFNTIGGVDATYRNIIGGNGFDYLSVTAPVTNYFGHGVQLNLGNVDNTTIRNNYIGIGPDGFTPVGNRQDGISILGSKDNTIQSNLIGNNAWGVFLQNDFQSTGSGSQPSGNIIISNLIGTDATGLIAVGNGVRAIDMEGGGVGIQHGSYANRVGTTTGRNVISGNRQGVAFRNSSNGGPVNNNIVQNNYIGLGIDGTTVVPNTTAGVTFVTRNVTSVYTNTIGGVNANESNYIAGNGTHGIEIDSSRGAKILNNFIGMDIAMADKGNGGDGINLHNGARHNIIGGTAAESNDIAYNNANGIQITNPNAAGANMNAINRNSFYCNDLRGIELNGSGNNNYPAPTFTGTPTNFSVTGGAWVELYTLDGCNSCPGGNTKLQGRTLVAEGAPGSAQVTNIDPATYGMTSSLDFTATSSSAAPSTVNGATTSHNTSEFSVCQTLCVTPVATAGSDQNVCAASATLAGNTPSIGAGVWTVVSGTATVTTPTSPTSTVTGLVVGSATFRWTLTDGACSAFDEVTITRDQVPTTANAGDNQEIACNTTTTTLAGNTPTIGTGLWTVVSGTAIITTPSSPTSAVTGLAANGAATLRWTVSNGTCTVSADDVVINTYTPPTAANAGPNQDLCNLTSATLAGNTPAIGTGLWTVVGGGAATITSATSATSTVTALAANGTVTLRWTVSNGTCTASSDDVVINTNTTPTTADAGIDQSVCASVATLAANTPTVGVGSWEVVSGGATITTPGSPTSGVTDLIVGTTVFKWTITNGACTASEDEISIVNSGASTAADAGPDQEMCNLTSATLAANDAAPGIGTWTVVSGTATISSPNNPTTTITGLGTGAITLTWSIVNGACAANTDEVVIRNFAIPTVSAAGDDQEICSATTATLAGNAPTIGIGLWEVVSGTATIATPSSPTSGVTGLAANGTATLSWTITNGTCSASADEVTIHTYTNPTTADASADQSVCSSNATLVGNIPTSGTGIWTVVSGGATITTPNSPTSGVTDLIVGTTVLRWEITNGNCTASMDEVSIVNSGSSIAAVAGIDQDMCSETSATLAATDPAPGTGLWTVVSGTATITTPASPTTTLTGLGTGAITLRWSVSNGACTVSTDEVVINNYERPNTLSLTGPVNVCEGSTDITFTTTDIPGATYAWTYAGSSISGNGNSVTISFPTGTASGEVRVTATANGCEDLTPTSVMISVNPALSVDITAPGFNICQDDQVTLRATISGGSPTAEYDTIWVFDQFTQVSESLTVSTQGSYTVNLISNEPACGTASDMQTVTVTPRPTVAVAGIDRTICGNSLQLNANLPLVGTGKWTVASGGGTGVFVDDTYHKTFVSGLSSNPIINKFVWTIAAQGTCFPETSDTVEVDAGNISAVKVIATALQDTFCLGGIANIEAVVEGTNATPYTFTWASSDGSFNLITQDPVSSTVSVTPATTGWVTYFIDIMDANGCTGNPSGKDSVYVVGQQALVVPNLITPNADNYNDCLIIRDTDQIDILPGSEFQLYNRWGQAVYKNNQYKNGDFCGSDLSDGMYYYHIKTGCGERELKGWLHIISNEASNK